MHQNTHQSGNDEEILTYRITEEKMATLVENSFKFLCSLLHLHDLHLHDPQFKSTILIEVSIFNLLFFL